MDLHWIENKITFSPLAKVIAAGPRISFQLQFNVFRVAVSPEK